MKLLILTTAFPYLPGEQFIESEIQKYENSKFEKITIIPYFSDGIERPYPNSISIDTALSKNRRVITYGVRALFSRIMAKEIAYIIRNEKFNAKNIYAAWKAVAQTLKINEEILSYCNREGVPTLIYSYWNDATAYAACLAKTTHNTMKVISRAHRFDIYEEHRENNYMPLKRQFVNLFDKVYLLSNEAKEYYGNLYHCSNEILDVARLGVKIPSLLAEFTAKDEFNIVSVSNCNNNKRIDRIIDSLELFASEHLNVQIRWVHIGDGELRKDLENSANHRFKKFVNLNHKFMGSVDNSEIIEYYKKNKVDVFINVSESEGIPVSIMEAMAAGIPAIATNVGEVSTLVGAEVGYLLSQEPSLNEINEALNVMLTKSKNTEVRMLAREKIEKNFHADHNYKNFIIKLETLAMSSTVPPQGC